MSIREHNKHMDHDTETWTNIMTFTFLKKINNWLLETSLLQLNKHTEYNTDTSTNLLGPPQMSTNVEIHTLVIFPESILDPPWN